jgi:hypothetical protein
MSETWRNPCGKFVYFYRRRIFRSRRAFKITETEDKDIAAPAIIGLSKVPVRG